LVVDSRGYCWIDVGENVFADPFLRRVMRVAVPVAGKDVIVALRPEQLRILAQAPGPRRVLNLVALATGLRESELAGLAWEHVDLEQGIIRVVRQLKKGRKAVDFKPPRRARRGSSRCTTLPTEPFKD
jgi:integrase